MRESSTNIQRYGFLTRAEGRYLSADSISAELKDAIAVAKAASPVGTHHLQIYNQILTSKYKALPPCDSTLAVHAVYREYTLSPITNLEL